MGQICDQIGCRREATEGEYCFQHAVLKRARWQCEAYVEHPLKAGMRRCPVVGSEIEEVNGYARCPRTMTSRRARLDLVKIQQRENEEEK